MDETWGYYGKINKPVTKRHILCDFTYTKYFIETKSRMMLSRGCEKGKKYGDSCFMCIECVLQDKEFQVRIVVMVTQDVLNTKVIKVVSFVLWIFYLNNKNRKRLSRHKGTWRKRKCTLLSERSPSEKFPLLMVPGIQHSGKDTTMESGKRWVVARG